MTLVPGGQLHPPADLGGFRNIVFDLGEFRGIGQPHLNFFQFKIYFRAMEQSILEMQENYSFKLQQMSN